MIKNTFFIVLIICTTLSGFAQDSIVATRYRPGIMYFFTGMRPANHIAVPRYDRLIVDILYNDLINNNSPKLFNSPASSIGFNFHFIHDIPFSKKKLWSLGIGLSYGHSKVKTNGFIQKNETTSQLIVFPDDTYDKAFFKSNRISIPIELRFKTQGWEHFKFHLGGRIGYQFATKSKVFKSDEIERIKNYNDLNRFTACVLARVGSRNWAITAAYYLTPYFKASESTPLNAFEIGLSVSLF